MKKNIIFDIGAVLVEWDPNRVYEPYFGDAAKMQLFYTETKIFDVNRKLDQGHSFDMLLQELSLAFPHYKKPILFWKEKWSAMLGGQIQGSIDILKNLYQLNYPLFALTNWSKETFPIALKQFDFFKYFIDIVVSGEEGFIKPDHQIYKILLQRNSLKAFDCLFIDDNLDNVKSAQNLGMDAIHFENPEKLINELRVKGIF